MIPRPALGTALTICGTAISVIGSYENNLVLDHHAAMLIWRWSNLLFAGYFFGRWRGYWDGGLNDAIMTGLYGYYTLTNEIGLAL